MSETKYIPGILCKYIDIELLITLSLNFIYTWIEFQKFRNATCAHIVIGYIIHVLIKKYVTTLIQAIKYLVLCYKYVSRLVYMK